MKKNYLTLVLFLLSAGLYSQEKLTVDWAQSFNDSIEYGGHTELQQTAVDDFGNVYICGYFQSAMDADPSESKSLFLSQGSNDFYLIKYDSLGNYLWGSSFGGASDDIAFGLAVDGNNDILITGFFYGTIDFDPSATVVANRTSNGGADLFIAKYNSGGAYQWAINIGGTSNDYYVNDIVTDNNNSVIITGDYDATVDFNPSLSNEELTSNGSKDIFLAKYDTDGNYEWARSFGAIGDDSGKGLSVDNNNDIIFTGFFSDTVDFDASAAILKLESKGYKDIFLVKYDEDGNYIWANGFGDKYNDIGSGVAIDANDNIIITGEYRDTIDFNPLVTSFVVTDTVIAIDNSDGFIAKYNSDGTYQWANSFGGPNGDYGKAVVIDGNNDIIFTGGFFTIAYFNPLTTTTGNLLSEGRNDIFIAKYTASGSYSWAFNLGSTVEEEGLDVSVIKGTNDIFLAGNFQATTIDADPGVNSNPLTTTWRNGILGKYRTNGDYAWATTVGQITGSTTYDGDCKASAMDSNGNVYVTGTFAATVDFDPSNAIANLTADGTVDIFLAKYDDKGNYLWAFSFGGAVNAADYGGGVAVDGNDDVIITGYFQGTTDFDPSSTTVNLATTGTIDGFLAKYSSSGSLIWAKQIVGDNLTLGYALTTDASNNIIVVGGYKGTTDFDPSGATVNITTNGDYDIFLAKYTSAGTYTWAVGIGGATGYDFGNAVAVDNTGKIAIIGNFIGTVDFDPSVSVTNLVSDGTADYDVAVAMYNSDGTFAWANSIGNSGAESGSGIAFDSNNNLVITGNFEGTVDFNARGVANNLTSYGEQDIYLAKYNGAGTCLWANNMGSIYWDYSYALAVDVGDEIIVSGRYQDLANFSTSSSTLELSSPGGYDIVIAKYNSDGGDIWANGIVCSNDDRINTISVGADNTIAVAGRLVGSSDYGVDETSVVISSTNGKDPFVALYRACSPITSIDEQTACGTYTWMDGNTYTSNNNSATHTLVGGASNGCDSVITLNLMVLDATSSDCVTVTPPIDEEEPNISSIAENTLFNTISIYPNPNSGIVNIVMGSLRDVSIQVSSISGQVVYQDNNVSSSIYQFSIDVMPGMYIVELGAKGQVEHYKLIVE